MQRRHRKFQFTAEPLEERRVMDGAVAVALAGNTLKITGDDLGNNVVVKMNGANLRIEGTLTNVTFNGNTAAFQEIAGLDFTKLQLKFNLKGGDDILAVGDNLAQITAKSLSIDTGVGSDAVGLNTLAIIGNAKVKTFKSAGENELDQVLLSGVSTFGRDLRIGTGGGNDAVLMVNGGQTTVGKRLTADVGAGADFVAFNVYNCTNATVRLGDGGNQFFSITGNVTQKLDVRGGKGSETMTANTGGTYNKISVNLGDGDDTATADGFTVADIRVNMGKGNDTAIGNALNMTQFDLFDGGAGNDTFNFNATNSNIPAAGALPKNFEVQNIT